MDQLLGALLSGGPFSMGPVFDPRNCLKTPNVDKTNSAFMMWIHPSIASGSPLPLNVLHAPQRATKARKADHTAAMAALLLGFAVFDEASERFVTSPCDIRQGVIDRLNGVTSPAAALVTPLTADQLSLATEVLPAGRRNGICLIAALTVLNFISSRVKQHDVFDRTYGDDINAHLGVFYNNIATLLELRKTGLLEYDLESEMETFFGMVRLFASHTRLTSVLVCIAERRFDNDRWAKTMTAAVTRNNAEVYKLLVSPKVIKGVDPKTCFHALTRNSDTRRRWMRMMNNQPSLPTGWFPVEPFLDETMKRGLCGELEASFWGDLLRHVLSKATLSTKHREYLLENLYPVPRDFFRKMLGIDNDAPTDSASTSGTTAESVVSANDAPTTNKASTSGTAAESATSANDAPADNTPTSDAASEGATD